MKILHPNFRHPQLDGLEPILARLANGEISEAEAARQIRALVVSRTPPFWVLKGFKYFGVVFVMIGVAFGIYSIAFGLGTLETEGTVIDMVGGHKGQAPIVEYRVKGQRLTLRGSVSSSPPQYSKGDKVSVLYRPENPQRAQINSFVERWFIPLVSSAVGTLITLKGIFAVKSFEKAAPPPGTGESPGSGNTLESLP